MTTWAITSLGAIASAGTATGPNFPPNAGVLGPGINCDNCASVALGVSGDGTTVSGVVLTVDGNDYVPAYWTSGGGWTLLALPGGVTDGETPAAGISNNGSFIGGITVGATDAASLWSGASYATQTDVPPMTGGTFTEGLGVSDSGQIVGYGDVGPANQLAFLWAGGTPTNIDTLGFLQGSIAFGISDDGTTVVGTAYNGFNPRAWFWTSGGGMTNMGSDPSDSSGTNATAVSADGSVIVGYSDFNAWRWTSGGGIVDLSSLSGPSFAYALGVSADGSVVVGATNNGSGTNQPWVWTSGDGIVNLPLLDPGGTAVAVDVSDDGLTIIGFATDSNPNTYAVMWAPEVPATNRPRVSLIG